MNDLRILTGQILRRVTCLCTTVLLALPAAAQTGLEPSPNAAAVAAEAAAAQARPADPPVRAVPARFTLRRIEIGPSDYLSEEALDSIRARFIGRRMTSAQAGRIAEAVNALYDVEGIGLAQASVAAIDPRRGFVRIALTEARIGMVEPRSDLARPEYLRWRLGVAPGDLADTRRLTDRLTRLSLTDGVAVDAGFSPGAAPGTTNLILTMADPAPVSGSIGLNNYADDRNAQEQLIFALRVASLTGRYDALTLQGSVSEGPRALSLGYAVPITADGLKLSFGLSAERTETVRGPLVVRDTRSAQIGLTLPLVLTESRQVYAFAGLKRYTTKAELVGVRFADLTGTELSLGASMTQAGPAQQTSLSGTLVLGRYDDDILAIGGNRYEILQAQAQHVRRLGDALILSLTASAQHSLNTALPSEARLSIAGIGAVRGYPGGLMSVDSGIVLRSQIEKAVPYRMGDMATRPFAFVDLGNGWQYTGRRYADEGLLASVGLGASVQIGERLFGDVLVAVPLRDVIGFADSGKPAFFAGVNVRF